MFKKKLILIFTLSLCQNSSICAMKYWPTRLTAFGGQQHSPKIIAAGCAGLFFVVLKFQYDEREQTERYASLQQNIEKYYEDSFHKTFKPLVKGRFD